MTRADLTKQPDAIAAMFDRVADRYDLTNDVLSLGQTRRWRNDVVRAIGVEPGEKILDVAAGTGSSTVPLVEAGAQATACDFSEGMVRVGRERYPHIDFVLADATSLPFDDETFDAVTISFGLRNIVDHRAALSEFRRVCRPGGRLVICEFSHPTNPAFRTVYLEYLMRALPSVARAVSSNPAAYEYLAESIVDWPDQVDLSQQIGEAGWSRVAWRNVSGGIVALHRAWR